MNAFEKLADHMLSELPIAQLQEMLDESPGPIERNGAVCGGNCGGAPGGTGVLCGLGCRPPAGAPKVLDREGRLGLTADDLNAIRADFPRLRQTVVDQLTAHLNQLR